MKKSLYILFAAALAIASASCTREEIFENEQTGKEVRTFTCSFDEDVQTRTEITKQGKTVWAEGDKIYVSNGTEADTLTVDSKFAGEKYFEFSTTLEGKIYVVYPVSAVSGITEDGKINVTVPSVQNGTFGSANIACAVANDRYVKMKNVTSVLSFKVPATVTTPVKAVSINSDGTKVAGTFTVDLSTGSPVITTSAENGYSQDVTVNVDGNNGNRFYATVIPGTYKAGFTMAAITLDLDKAIESKTTVSDKELKVNAYYDLGSIGENLRALGGDGSQSNPYQISSYAEFLVFSNYVNAGNTMRGKSVKLMNDISVVRESVGSVKFDSRGTVIGKDGASGVGNEIAEGNIPFQGEFDGNGKTVTVNLDNTSNAASGLFANVSDSAYIHDVTVAGNVKSNYKHAAGLVGFARTRTNDNSKPSITIANCKNTATVSGVNYAGGIVSWVDNTNKVLNTVEINNCSNEGAVTGNNLYVGGVGGALSYANLNKCSNSGAVTSTVFVGGIAGYSYQGSILDCTNSGDVTATVTAGNFYGVVNKKYTADYRGGAAGIAAYAQNVTLKRCSNSGNISGVNKVGGIAGTIYWTNVYSCKNTGKVSATAAAAGGVVGWAFIKALVYDCQNSGEVYNEMYQAGGIVGQAQTTGNVSYHVEILKCTNEGKASVGAKGNGAAGILGFAQPYTNGQMYVNGCINKGEISGPTYSGGIVGAAAPIYTSRTWAALYIFNCENHATVYGTATGQKANVFVGGILGGAMKNFVNQGTDMYNCLNTGDVLYADATALYPNAGGIAGRIYQGTASGRGIHNCYNSGRVGPVTGTPVAGALYGGIVGYSQSGSGTGGRISHSYWLDSACDQMTGTASKYTDLGCISAVGADGVFSTALTYNDKSYDKVVDILNAWRNGNLSYYAWTAGPKFVYPSYTDFGSGDYDLGNGGEI